MEFPKQMKQIQWTNDKTMIELGSWKISWFVRVSQINYLPQPSASANNWSAGHWQITIFLSTSSNNCWLFVFWDKLRPFWSACMNFIHRNFVQTNFMHASGYLLFSMGLSSINTQGVLKLRKRVTLMIVAVSIIFGICWGVDQVVYTLMFTANIDVGHIPVAIANTMVLFNAAVNPFVYALLNKQFRQKAKRMICCTCSWTSRYHLRRERQDIEHANSTTPSTQPTQ